AHPLPEPGALSATEAQSRGRAVSRFSWKTSLRFQEPQQLRLGDNTRPSLMFGVQRHPHEQRGQEDENICLQEGNEQFQQTQSHHTEYRGDGYSAEQPDVGLPRRGDNEE